MAKVVEHRRFHHFTWICSNVEEPRIFRFIDEVFFRYLYSRFISMKLINRFIDRNNLSKKLLSVICDISVSPSVILLQMDVMTDKARKKKIYSLHSIGISIAKYNISLIEKLYIISSVIFFVRR